MPYLPARTLLGTDVLARNPRLRPATCPFTGVPLVLVPALAPDVAILHVQRADADGNCHAWGPTGVSAAAGKASRSVIVICEELVEPDVIRSDPNRLLLPGFLVSAVVHLPWGAHPSPVQGHYNRDHAVYADYHQRTATAEGAPRGSTSGCASCPTTPRTSRSSAASASTRCGRGARLAAPVDYGC